MSNLREECGVFGVFSHNTDNIAPIIYYGLFALQHRGQEAAGMVINDRGIFSHYKDVGLVNDIFTGDIIASLGHGNIGVGHVRYGTTGSGDRVNTQPIVVNHHKGRMAVAHNGNLVNYLELRRELELEGGIFHTTSDTEVIAYLITKERIHSDSIEEAVKKAMKKLKGAYSLVITSPSKLVIARDPMGFRPLCWGKIEENDMVIAASESCALDSVGATHLEDVKAGEIITFSKDGIKHDTELCTDEKNHLCIFEYLYFARPDSVIDGISINRARERAGAILAEEYKVDADVVIGVPDSGLPAAMGYAKESGIPYGVGLIKNKYIGRTFIAPGQEHRQDRVKIKLNALRDTVSGKSIVLVDDSIVRGTTSKRIVKLLKEAGAKKVHLMSTAPPFIDACYYGTDVASKENLIACNFSVDEICREIGADSLGYLPIKRLGEILNVRESGDRKEDINVQGFCSSCFTGIYPTDIPSGLEDPYSKKICNIGEAGNEQK